MQDTLIGRVGEVSEMMKGLNESATLAMARIAREMTAAGHDVVSLSLGEPDFDTPDFIKEAAIAAIHNNITHYPPVNGFLDVREAIVAKFKRDNNLTYKPTEILVSTGAKQCIANIIFALVNPGDEVILPAPYWVSYAELVRLAGGKVISIPSKVENDFKMTASGLEAVITPKTKLIIYSSPSNPTGSVYTKEELESFASVIEKHEDLYVLSDEIYEHIIFSGKNTSIASIGNMWDRTITVNGVAKAFAMTGWRIGYMGGPKWIVDACIKMQGQITSGANTIAQMATKAAVLADVSKLQYMVDIFRRRRDLMFGLLQEIPQIKVNLPDGAFYFFPDVSAYYGKSDGGKVIRDSNDLSTYLLEKKLVAVVPGDAFGGFENIRLSYAASDEKLREAVKRIKEGLAELK
ncbi:MAG: pyridoxal phosphate-dependent aminotransferase [Flavobacteriales bacterium]|nr:pyridoxal phosphate-dependent aminotransferase [Flavobacteriales bacterium]